MGAFLMFYETFKLYTARDSKFGFWQREIRAGNQMVFLIKRNQNSKTTTGNND